MAAIKFCGLTRPDDARQAAALGARYAGVIFAGGPRQLTVERAVEVFGALTPDVGRAGVFAAQSDDEILKAAERLALTVVQLHGDQDAARVSRLRARFGGEIWPVIRVAAGRLPDNARELAMAANTFLLDTLGPGGLGGSGQTFDWRAIEEPLRELRAGRRLVLAGGLHAENVASAIATLQPDVVDVASGVEASPGIKDHQRMRAFRDAALGATSHA